MARLFSFAVLLMAVASGAANAQMVDAIDCESAASSLSQEASSLESAANDLDNATGREIRDAEGEVRSQASSVMSAAEQVRLNCAPFATPIPIHMILGIIQGHLLTRFGSGPQSRAKLEKIEPDLQELAQAHARVRPTDFRMTLAVAELVYLSADQ